MTSPHRTTPGVVPAHDLLAFLGELPAHEVVVTGAPGSGHTAAAAAIGQLGPATCAEAVESLRPVIVLMRQRMGEADRVKLAAIGVASTSELAKKVAVLDNGAAIVIRAATPSDEVRDADTTRN